MSKCGYLSGLKIFAGSNLDGGRRAACPNLGAVSGLSTSHHLLPSPLYFLPVKGLPVRVCFAILFREKYAPSLLYFLNFNNRALETSLGL